MAQDYNREDFLHTIRSIDASVLYERDEVNYLGCTKDTKELYTELIAKYLLDNIDILKSIPVHKREYPYFIKEHLKREVPPESTPRKEERLAIQLFHKYREREDLSEFGRILDYQVPLKVKRSDFAGKIDLISVKKGKLRVLELKVENSDETMLRCALESYTYSRVLWKEKFLREYGLPPETKIIPTPLVFKNKHQYTEYYSDDHRYLRELMESLSIQPIFISEI